MAYTMAQIAKHTENKLMVSILNAAMENSYILQMLPMNFWGKGTYLDYLWERSRPTTTNYTDGATLSSTTGDDDVVRTYLQRKYSQSDLENYSLGVQNGAVENATLKQARSFGAALRDGFVYGAPCSVAIGATCTTKGVDAVVVGPRTPAGRGSLKFDDTANTLQYKAPGDADYGTARDVSGDFAVGHDYLFSENKSYWIRITFDFSDSDGGGDWETSSDATGLTITRTSEMDSMLYLCQPDRYYYASLSQTTPSSGGDAISLAVLDHMISQMPFKANRAFFGNSREVNKIRQLLGAAGGMQPAMWNGAQLAGDVVSYRGIPVVPEDNIPLTEVVTGGLTTGGWMALAHLDAEEGLCGWWGNPGDGAVMTKLRDDNGGPVPFPVWTRLLGESTTADTRTLRTTGFFQMGLKSYQGLYIVHGIKAS